METVHAHTPRFLETVEDLLARGHAVRFRAQGWSMYPTIRNGESITVMPLEGLSIQPGDIVLYRRSSGSIAHRVIAVQLGSDGSTELILRGDAEDACDSPVRRDQVLGHVRVGSAESARQVWRTSALARSWRRLVARAIRRGHDARLKTRDIVGRAMADR